MIAQMGVSGNIMPEIIAFFYVIRGAPFVKPH